MSRLRPETCAADGPALPDDTALFLVRHAVECQRELIHGRLHDGRGLHCAVGALWATNPNLVLHTALVDEIAAVNDSVPPTATPRERWLKVRSWLRWKLRVMANVKKGR